MDQAEWIMTFDDGPLPADVASADGRSDEELLGPLAAILDVLATHDARPIPAVFYLRGPAYPWSDPPPRQLYHRGVRMILDAGHHVGIHCFKHDPALWWWGMLRGREIREDLDRCVAYFEPMIQSPMTTFRPPFGRGGVAARRWATERRIRVHRWDIDCRDWLHLRHALPFPRFADDSAGHLRLVLDTLPRRMRTRLRRPGPRDFMLHVSVRTAGFLPQIIEQISQVSRSLGHEPQFVVPESYLHPEY